MRRQTRLPLAAVLAMVSATIHAQTQPETPVLRVQGSAEVRVVPDLATVRLGMISDASTAQDAQDAVNVAANAVLTAVEEIGIETQHVQTTRLTLSPLYAPRRPEARDEPRVIGYRASTVLSVRIEQLDLVGPVIDAALEAGANQLEGVSFGLRDSLSAREDALRQAIVEARAKAAAIADALGVELGPVASVNEDNVFVHEPMPMMESVRAMAMPADAPTTVSAGEVSVSASVSIAYRIE